MPSRVLAQFARPVLILLSVFSLVLPYTPATAAGEPKLRIERHEHEPHELLVKFRADAAPRNAEAAVRGEGAREVQAFKRPRKLGASRMDHWRLVKFAPGVDIEKARARLLKNRHVERVEYNYRVSIGLTPSDPLYPQLWGLNNTGQTGGKPDADIDAPEAWDLQTGNQDVVVAVIDTGVDYTHPDLAANVWTNPGEIPGNGIDDDGNGYVDDVYGYDFYNNDANPLDDHGHGTHVSGTIAGVGDNGIGVAGVSWRARIMGVKFLGAGGSGSTSGAISAVLYAADMGARVMNNSWGGGGYSQALYDAIVTADQAGALFVAAAGNSGSNNDVTPNYPSNYDVPNVLAVAATDHNDAKASFSSYGATTVDLGAPGVNILSTVPTVGNACCSDPSGYKLLSGTSMATPHVSGAATLLFAHFPGITHQQVKARLMTSAEPIAALQGITVTGGRLNIAVAFEDDTTPPAPVADLAVANVGAFSVTLGWGATGDDGLAGTAASYDLRYSTAPINETNFNAATAVGPVPVTGPAGTIETYTIQGLEPQTQYYFALKVRDNVGNLSPISNVTPAITKSVTVFFSDNFESGAGNWTVAGTDGVGGPALWHVSAHRYASPSNAMYYGKESTLNYDTGARNYGSITSGPISLAGAKDSALAFNYFLATENLSPYDTARVQVSKDNGATWTDLFVTASSSSGMVKKSVSLAAYDGQVIRLRFSFDTGDSILNGFEGWVVDDVQVLATNLENDTAPPAAIIDLTVKDVTTTGVALGWTAPGDDGNAGTASGYDLRYSTSPIDDGNFDLATPVTGLPKPAPAGTIESFVVTGLAPGNQYYFAIKSVDNVGNQSGLSNVPTAVTKPIVVAFKDDFESGAGNWAVAGTDGVGGPALWHVSPHRFASPSNAMYYGKESTLNYDTGARNYGSITSGPINLKTVIKTRLSLNHFLATENLAPFDTARVQVSNDDGVSWKDLYVSAIGTNGNMVKLDFDLSAYDGQVIRLRFAFDTVDSAINSYEGWVVDDVLVQGEPLPPAPPTASAGGPYTGVMGQEIQFNGSGSSDPNDDPLTYAWDFGDGATGTGIAPTHVYVAKGSYTVSLVVNDGAYDSAPATTTVTIVNQAPIANAGGPYSVPKKQPLTFDGTKSYDPDADPIISYNWDFGDGNIGTGVSPTHIYAKGGTYTVTLFVNDGLVDSALATTTVTVTNQAPTADVGGPYTGVWNRPIIFNGAGSSDADGDALTYQWNFGDGATTTGPNPTHAYAQPGAYTVTLTVHDGEVASALASTIATVTNQAPIADAGGPYSGAKKTAIAFDGSKSTDADGDALTFKWSFGDGTAGTGASPTHVYAKGGTYTVTLVVNDGLVDSAPATTTVTVTNQAPVASFTGPASAFKLTMLAWDASGSTDADGDALTYKWSFGDGNSKTTALAQVDYGFSYIGTYTVTLVVNDGEVDSAPATRTIEISSKPPVANAGPDQTVQARSIVYLSGRESYDPDGYLTSGAWRQVSGPSVTLSNADSLVFPYFVAPNVKGNSPEVLVFELTVTDDDGVKSSDQVTITVVKR